MKRHQILKPVIWSVTCAGVMMLCYYQYAERENDVPDGNMFEVIARAFNPICYSLNERDYVYTAPDHSVFRAAKRLKIPRYDEQGRIFIYTAILLESCERSVGDIALESVISENETDQFKSKLVLFWKSRINKMANIDHGVNWTGKRLFDGIALLASKDQDAYVKSWGIIDTFFSGKTPFITPEQGKKLMKELDDIFMK